jgi:hypothetical protein
MPLTHIQLGVTTVRRACIAFAAIALALSMSVPAASAPTRAPAHRAAGTHLRAIVDMVFVYPGCPLTPPDVGDLMQIVPDATGCWYGTVEGDVDGTIAFWETSPNFVAGNTEYFFEVFTFLPESGGFVWGVDQGIWSLRSWVFTANGWVTATSDDWTDLLGASYSERGKTSDPDGWPVTGYGTRASFTKASS